MVCVCTCTIHWPAKATTFTTSPGLMGWFTIRDCSCVRLTTPSLQSPWQHIIRYTTTTIPVIRYETRLLKHCQNIIYFIMIPTKIRKSEQFLVSRSLVYSQELMDHRLVSPYAKPCDASHVWHSHSIINKLSCYCKNRQYWRNNTYTLS